MTTENKKTVSPCFEGVPPKKTHVIRGRLMVKVKGKGKGKSMNTKHIKIAFIASIIGFIFMLASLALFIFGTIQASYYQNYNFGYTLLLLSILARGVSDTIDVVLSWLASARANV